MNEKCSPLCAEQPSWGEALFCYSLLAEAYKSGGTFTFVQETFTTLIIHVFLRTTLPHDGSTSSKSELNTANFKMSLSEPFNYHIYHTLFLSSPSGLLSHIAYNKKQKPHIILILKQVIKKHLRF